MEVNGMEDLQARLDRHYRFGGWRRRTGRSSVFPWEATSLPNGLKQLLLLVHNKEILPEMINPKDFLADYERQYQESLETGQDAFWVAEPFCGIALDGGHAGLQDIWC